MVSFDNENDIKVKITNLLGQIVFCQNANNATRFEINTVNLLSKSIYTVSVESRRARGSNKLILN